MITAHIVGGLGNQLFQIFNLIAYCLRNGMPFYFENDTPTRSDRPYYWNNFLSSLKPFFRNINVNPRLKLKLPVLNERGFHYTPFKKINRSFKFNGYFQSYKYFIDKQSQICKLINLDIQTNRVREKYKELYDFENTISLHFRLGDYKKLQNIHPVLPLKYYMDSLEYILDKNSETWNVLVFYEKQDEATINININKLKEHFSNKLNFTAINTNIVDYEQLLLMSLCKHNIIANSTFSWWGAYLNRKSDKIVCCPEIWFGGGCGHNTKDLYYPEWKIL